MLLMKTSLYQKIYQETLSYMNDLKNYWLDQKDTTTYFFNHILGISEPSLTMIAYISHPGLNTGVNIGDNTFFFGHYRGVKDLNYNYVYFLHETLHTLIRYDIMPAHKLYADMKKMAFGIIIGIN